MRYTKLALLSTLSAVALLTAASTSSDAFSRPVTDMGLLRTRTDWSVGPIMAKNANYCAMVGKYDKDVTLAFARNQDGFGSLALNFKNKVLEAGKMYDVTLQIDDMEARQYSVRAANANSAIIQVGQDEDFYTSLGGNGVLNIDIASLKIAFALNDFSSSYISLVSCADKLQHGEDVGPRTAAMPVPAVEKTPLPNGQKVAAATTPPSSLTTAEARASAPVSLTAPPPQPTAAAKTVAAAPGPGVPTTVISSADDFDKRLAEEKARQNLQQQADLVRKFADDSRLTQEENKDLKAKLAKATEDQADLKNKMALLKLEKDELASRVDMQDRQYKVLEAALSAKERDLSAVRGLSIEDNRSLVNVRKELEGLKMSQASTIKDLQDKLADKTEQYAALQSQYQDLEKMHRSALADASHAQTELDLSRQSLSETQQRLSSSERQSKSLFENMRDQLDKARSQMSMFESQLSTLAMQKDDLANRLDIQTRQNNELRASLEDREQQIAALRSRMSDMASVNNTSLPPLPAPSKPLPTITPEVLPAPPLAALPPMPSMTGPAEPVGGAALLPPALQPIIKRGSDENISSSKPALRPAINPQVSTGRDIPEAPVLKLKASVTDVQTSPVPADESWDTIIVQ